MKTTPPVRLCKQAGFSPARHRHGPT